MRNPTFFLILIGIMLVLEIYVFQALKMVVPPTSPRVRMALTVIYWLFAVLVVGAFIAMVYFNYDSWPKSARVYVLAIVVGTFFSLVVASLFLVVDDIRRGATWIIVRMFRNPAPGTEADAEKITRSVFMSWMGLIFGGGLFSTLIYGFSNKYNYTVRRVVLNYSNLPEAFRGLKIVQLSDIHSGSFMDKKAVQRGVEKVLEENPDLILFTGDLVNDYATEMVEYMDVFDKLKANMGVYSVLGNHDYGDYVRWPDAATKVANLERLKNVHGLLGWTLLMNENVIFERGDQRIALLGIENWSAKSNFPKHGRLDEAHAGTEHIPFKILMSHDPSHWDAEVRPQYSDIDLTLAGHTHGMQFGVEIPGFKWSPVQYMYKQWAGLYEEGNQKLYINRGFGFIGYPGRVGILPEITVITLT
ncbi:MAG: metallophosphoesterase [Chitinophagaceae bacterium]|nr:metallophosphoesterase [Chitinophagaceae bacterium]